MTKVKSVACWARGRIVKAFALRTAIADALQERYGGGSLPALNLVSCTSGQRDDRIGRADRITGPKCGALFNIEPNAMSRGGRPIWDNSPSVAVWKLRRTVFGSNAAAVAIGARCMGPCSPRIGFHQIAWEIASD